MTFKKSEERPKAARPRFPLCGLRAASQDFAAPKAKDRPVLLGPDRVASAAVARRSETTQFSAPLSAEAAPRHKLVDGFGIVLAEAGACCYANLSRDATTCNLATSSCPSMSQPWRWGEEPGCAGTA